MSNEEQKTMKKDFWARFYAGKKAEKKSRERRLWFRKVIIMSSATAVVVAKLVGMVVAQLP